jgi:hypothetical protein
MRYFESPVEIRVLARKKRDTNPVVAGQ